MQLTEYYSSPSLACLQETLQQVLSSSRLLREQFQFELSALPIHPYQKLLAQYFEPGEQVLSIENVPTPLSFNPITTTSQITAISKKFYEATIEQANALTAENIPETCNAFAVLSGEEFIVDHQRVKNHLTFLEMSKAITVEMIEKNPQEVAKRVLSEFVRLYAC